MKKWVWIWTAWFVGIFGSFAVLEFLGWDTLTLSRYMWNISKEWPLFIFLCGALAGGLAVHLWWHWLPPGSKSEG